MRKILNAQKYLLANGFFSKNKIESILEDVKFLDFNSNGTIVDSYGNAIIDKKIRDSSNCVVDNDSEIGIAIYRSLELLSLALYDDSDKLKTLVDAIDIIRYEKGQKVREHLDAFSHKEFVGANREYTLMIGLQSATIGGETVFTKWNKTFKLNSGEVLLWSNLKDGKADFDSVHRGNEVTEGVKYIAVLFIKQEKNG